MTEETQLRIDVVRIASQIGAHPDNVVEVAASILRFIQESSQKRLDGTCSTD